MEFTDSKTGEVLSAGNRWENEVRIYTRMTSLRPARRLLLAALAILSTVGCDQATKLIARDHLVPGKPLIYAGDLFRLQYAENKGAFLGLGSTLPDTVREGIFTVGAGIMLLAMLVWLLRARRMSPWNTLAVALFFGGGLGNLIDRVFRDGRVIDFLNVGIGGLRSGIFNVADMAITAGLVMLFLGDVPFRRLRRKVPPEVGTT